MTPQIAPDAVLGDISSTFSYSTLLGSSVKLTHMSGGRRARDFPPDMAGEDGMSTAPSFTPS